MIWITSTLTYLPSRNYFLCTFNLTRTIFSYWSDSIHVVSWLSIWANFTQKSEAESAGCMGRLLSVVGGSRWKNTKQEGSSIRTPYSMWRDINIQNWAQGSRDRKTERGLRCLPSRYTTSNNNTETSALVVWELSVWRSTMLKSHKIWRQAVLVFTTWCSHDWRICVKLFSSEVPSEKTSYSWRRVCHVNSSIRDREWHTHYVLGFLWCFLLQQKCWMIATVTVYVVGKERDFSYKVSDIGLPLNTKR
jgi:hypothetical protein